MRRAGGARVAGDAGRDDFKSSLGQSIGLAARDVVGGLAELSEDDADGGVRIGEVGRFHDAEGVGHAAQRLDALAQANGARFVDGALIEGVGQQPRKHGSQCIHVAAEDRRGFGVRRGRNQQK